MWPAASRRIAIAQCGSRRRCVVLLIEYRLAPEHPFPAALEGAVAAVRWMREHGPDGRAAARRAFLLGESAGGGLALATLLAPPSRARRYSSECGARSRICSRSPCRGAAMRRCSRSRRSSPRSTGSSRGCGLEGCAAESSDRSVHRRAGASSYASRGSSGERAEVVRLQVSRGPRTEGHGAGADGRHRAGRTSRPPKQWDIRMRPIDECKRSPASEAD